MQVGWRGQVVLSNLKCRDILLNWIIVGQGTAVLAVDASGDCLDVFSHTYLIFSSLSIWKTAQYSLRYCFKEPLNPNQLIICIQVKLIMHHWYYTYW